jgi:nucleotide-binding universal stress UspA family protein
MTIRTVLFIADDDRTTVAGLRYTCELTRPLEAHVTMAWIGETAEQSIASETLEKGATITVLRHPTMDEAWVAGLARHADLAVISLPRAGTAERIQDMRLIERLTRHVGCPVLALPPRIVPTRVTRRVAIGWNASPPAQRAVRAALPLLAKSDQVAVVSIDADRPLDVGAKLQHFLERHAIRSTVEPIVSHDTQAGPLIEQAVEQLDADLLVIGAWSRPPLAERLFGGATRHLLGRLGVPIVISA